MAKHLTSSPPAGSRVEVHGTADRLHSAAIHLLRRLRRADTASGLSPARLSALSVLVFGGPRTIGALAAAEQVAAPTMTKLVAGLVRDGLVRRHASTDDRRRVHVEATAAGVRLMQQGRARRIAAFAELLASVSETDLATLARAADILEGIESEDKDEGRSSLAPNARRR
jgi:DNA-binding MarR family transcriptional regulator